MQFVFRLAYEIIRIGLLVGICIALYIADGEASYNWWTSPLLCCVFVAAFVGTNWKRSGGPEISWLINVDHHFLHDICHFGFTPLLDKPGQAYSIFIGWVMLANVWDVNHNPVHGWRNVGFDSSPYHQAPAALRFTYEARGQSDGFSAFSWGHLKSGVFKTACSVWNILIKIRQSMWNQELVILCGRFSVGHQLVKSLRTHFIDLGSSGDRVQLSQWGN